MAELPELEATGRGGLDAEWRPTADREVWDLLLENWQVASILSLSSDDQLLIEKYEIYC